MNAAQHDLGYAPGVQADVVPRSKGPLAPRWTQDASSPLTSSGLLPLTPETQRPPHYQPVRARESEEPDCTIPMPQDPSWQVRVLFDESHSESWSISPNTARDISPEYPENNSYALASGLLSKNLFSVERHLAQQGPLTDQVLADADIVVLGHPCDPRWERVVPGGSPRLTREEIDALRRFTEAGGGLLIVTEYEHDKYGDNLEELLEPWGISLQNSSVLDRTRHVHGNPAWIHAVPARNTLAQSLTWKVEQATFYQAGTCEVRAPAQPIWLSGPMASPANAAVMAAGPAGRGRVVVVMDSLLFGDDHLHAAEGNHAQLWLNLFQWLACPKLSSIERPNAALPGVATPHAWHNLKSLVNQLRVLQQPGGEVPSPMQPAASVLVGGISAALEELKPEFSHLQTYFEALSDDFKAWMFTGFGKPDFARSLGRFHPELQRVDGLEHIVVFPMYTPNASSDIRFEALRIRVPWPEWLAHLEKHRFHNGKFAPGHLMDHSEGYNSECAVLFPETVAVASRATNAFATLFCDREARRLQAYARASILALQVQVPPILETILTSTPILEDTLALWDLIHDRAHSLGELPFDPFMIRQRSPFWMYALEELRVDLTTYREARHLSASGFPFAQYVPMAILMDRLFRFPLVGSRVRNYDGLAGQLLFAFLHEHEYITWCDNRLTLDWNRLDAGMDELLEKIARLYKHGAVSSKLSFWIEAHDLISQYVRPHVASVWIPERRTFDNESDPGQWVCKVQEDEFPLGHFHLNLKRKLGDIRWRAT